MKNMVRLLLVVLPVLAVCTFLLVRKQLGGIAPMPPVASSIDEAATPAPTMPPSARTAQLNPTVLAPEPNQDGTTLPPGVTPSESGPAIVLENEGNSTSDEVIPISDLQQPTTLLEFPE